VIFGNHEARARRGGGGFHREAARRHALAHMKIRSYLARGGNPKKYGAGRTVSSNRVEGWLLVFSRRQSQQFRRVELNALIIGLIRHLRTILPANIELEMRLDPVRRERIGDPAALEDALIHLTLNSRDAMPDGGTLTLETTSVEQRAAADSDSSGPRRYILLRVMDTGIAMDEIAQTEMFEPFHSANAEDSALGLGLSAVYGIVKQANGWISIQAGKDGGSVVEIFLPMAEAASTTTA